MIYPAGDTLKERIRNRYSLVVLASKRAKQLKEGAPPLIDTISTNSLTIALEEIAAGKVTYVEHNEAPEDDESPSSNTPAASFYPTSSPVENPSSTASLADTNAKSLLATEPEGATAELAAGETKPLSDQPDGIEEA